MLFTRSQRFIYGGAAILVGATAAVAAVAALTAGVGAAFFSFLLAFIAVVIPQVVLWRLLHKGRAQSGRALRWALSRFAVTVLLLAMAARGLYEMQALDGLFFVIGVGVGLLVANGIAVVSAGVAPVVARRRRQ